MLGEKLLWHFWGRVMEEEWNNFSWPSFLNLILNLVLALDDLIIRVLAYCGEAFKWDWPSSSYAEKL